MEANFQSRMKRKGSDDVDNDFSDFPFSSPATKIRRLDAELPPMVIVDEEAEVATVVFNQPPEQSFNNSGWKIEELPNEEKAIVLYDPSISLTTPIVRSPSNFSISLHPQFISGLKNQLLRPTHADSWRVVANVEEDSSSPCSSSGNGCQAVIPWTPPRFSGADVGSFAYQTESSGMMDDEEMGEASMDVEDSVVANANEFGMVPPTTWQPQQHCTIMQPPHSTKTPIVWHR